MYAISAYCGIFIIIIIVVVIVAVVDLCYFFNLVIVTSDASQVKFLVIMYENPNYQSLVYHIFLETYYHDKHSGTPLRQPYILYITNQPCIDKIRVNIIATTTNH